MHLKSRNISLLILALTSVALSRILFALFNDPEGPNLLVVAVAAVIIYLLSLAVFLSLSSFTDPKRVPLTVFAQVIITAALYFSLG